MENQKHRDLQPGEREVWVKNLRIVFYAQPKYVVIHPFEFPLFTTPASVSKCLTDAAEKAWREDTTPHTIFNSEEEAIALLKQLNRQAGINAISEDD